MKKSLSLLVAIAMVFSMFATVVSAAGPAPGQSAGQYLQELGVILGNQDGDLKEDQTWKRQDIVVLLSRLLGVEAEAKAAAKTHEFTDVTDANYDGYISWAVEEGLVEGKGNGIFGFNDELKLQEFYALVLRAFKLEIAYDEVPAKAVELGLAEEDADFAGIPTRGTTYTTIVTALNTEVPGTGKTLGVLLGLIEVTDLTLSAAATGVKKFTLTFNQAVDKSQANVTVRNNNIAVNIKEATWAEDNKSVVLEFANNLAAADYTVTVSGLSEEALTATVKVEAQKVEKIEFQSDKAPLVRGVNNQITVGYVVTNQYGEDITSSVSLTPSASKGRPEIGNGAVTVTVDGQGFYNINEVVHVSLLHVDGAYATVAATVSAEARVSAVAVEKLYQPDNKILEVGGAEANTFKLVLDLKDQYGNNVTNATHAKDDMVITVSNPTVASLVGYANGSTATVTTESIDGSNKLVLTVDGPLTAGTSVVTIMSKSTGARATFDLVVKDSVKVDVLTLSAPAYAPAGEEIAIPFTAVDQFGNTIEHPTDGQINKASSSISGNGEFIGFVKDVVKNTTALKVKLPTTKGPAIVTVLTGTDKFVQLTVNVTDAPEVTVISGTKDFATSLLKSDAVTVGTGNIVVKDQYNSDITPSYSNTTAEDGKYRLVLTSSNASVVSISNNGEIYNNQSVVLTGAARGTATITVKIEKAAVAGSSVTWTEVANSSFTYTQRVVEKSDIKSYEAVIDGVIYAGTIGTTDGKVEAHNKKLTVQGVLDDNGTKVTIPNNTDNYEVTIDRNGVSFADGRIVADATVEGFNNDGKLEVPVIVVIKGATTEIETLTATISNVDPKVETVGLKSSGPVAKESDTTVSVSVADVRAIASDNAETVRANLRALATQALDTKDQYGVSIAPGVVNAVASISNFAGVNVGDTFTVAGVAGNNKTFNFTVIVKQ